MRICKNKDRVLYDPSVDNIYEEEIEYNEDASFAMEHGQDSMTREPTLSQCINCL